MKVQLLDLEYQYKKIRKEVLREVTKVCDSQRYVLAENVKSLEEEIARFTGSKYAVGVASGSDALLIALMALGVGKGDKVITTPYTFFSTASSIARLGAEPVFVDIDHKTYNIDVNLVESALKKRKGVKAILPVHLYGQTADMKSLKSLGRKYGAKVIEDACQSIGAEFNGKGAGSMGDAGCFSFYPTKNLGGFGDGGMVSTNSKATRDKVLMLRGHGASHGYFHKVVGLNSRLDELQAAVLRVKLKYLNGWAEGRRKNAARYGDLFKKADLGGNLTVPFIEDGNTSVFNQYIVRVKKRDKLRQYLGEKGVGSNIYYPLSLHLQECFGYLGYKKGSMPESEKASKETLALPIYPELTSSEVRYVVSTIKDFYSKKR